MIRKLVIILLLCNLFRILPTATAHGSLYSGKIIFQSFVEQSADLFVLNLDDVLNLPHNAINLTRNQDINIFPDASPDGKQIIFQRQPYVANLPVNANNGHNQIFVMNSDGSGQVNLTHDPEGDYFFPTWSPDGKQISYVFGHNNNRDYDIYVMNADGSHRVQLTRTPGVNSYPQWSPDGKFLLFESNRDNVEGSDIYRMDKDGTNVTRLTFSSAVGEFNNQAIWTSNGSGMIYASGTRKGSSSILFRLNFPTMKRTQLTDSDEICHYPHESPDGQWIVYQVHGTPLDSIYIMKADGSNPLKVAEGFGPTWLRK